MNQQPAPQPNILNPRFKYTSSVDTDIRKTWAKFGWTPKEKRNGPDHRAEN